MKVVVALPSLTEGCLTDFLLTAQLFVNEVFEAVILFCFVSSAKM